MMNPRALACASLVKFRNNFSRAQTFSENMKYLLEIDYEYVVRLPMLTQVFPS